MIKQSRIISSTDLHVLRALFIIILLWLGVWGFSDEMITYIQQKYTIERWKIYAGIIFIMVFIILIDPYTFEKL